MHVERHTVEITTATGGGGDGYTPTVTGRIAAVVYEKDGAEPFATGVDFAVTSERTGEEIWVENDVDASKTVRPLGAGSTTSGATATGAYAPIAVALDRVKIAVADGGDAKRGVFHVVII